VQIDKSQIVDLLKSQGKQQQADQAEQELPQKVDHQDDASLLTKLGIDPGDLLKMVSGGGGGGGIPGVPGI